MQSALVILFMTLMMTMISDPRQWWLDYAQGQRRNIAQLMGYYNGLGVAMCGDALSEYHNHQTPLPAQCVAGVMPLASASGSASAMKYGTAFQTFTDGDTYIATTVATQTIGHVSLRGITDDAILSELGQVADGSALYVGHYSALSGGIVMNNLPLTNGTTTTGSTASPENGQQTNEQQADSGGRVSTAGRIIPRQLTIMSPPVAMQDGQPFIVTMMY